MYMNFRQNFSQKKKSFAILEKTLAETVNCIPKGLRKGNPFYGPFSQLSFIPTHLPVRLFTHTFWRNYQSHNFTSAFCLEEWHAFYEVWVRYM